jgi:hypothetical protein
MKYSEDIDYLLAAVLYLGSSTYWWGRTPERLADALGLNETRLSLVLDGYPGLFRKSKNRHDNGQVSYSLQARYAEFDSKDGKEPKTSSDIPPISTEKIKFVLDFIHKMVEQEKTDDRSRITNRIAVSAAIVSALTALTVGGISLAKGSRQTASIDGDNSVPSRTSGQVIPCLCLR